MFFSWMHGKMFPKYKKRNVTFFSKLRVFHSRCNWGSASDYVLLKDEWYNSDMWMDRGHYMSGVKSLSALWSHGQDTSWIIIDRSTLIQYHVYFFLSNGLGGAVFRRPMHPTMKSTRVGPIIFYYILDRVVLVHRSGVHTCFKNRLHLNI